MKRGPFRVWITNIWMENCDETRLHNGLPMPLEEYFSKYKWWLRQAYRYHTEHLN